MNAQQFHDIFNKLPAKRKEYLLLYLGGKSKDEIMSQLGLKDPTNMTNHLRNACKNFDIIPEAYTDYLYELVELFSKYKPEIISPVLLKRLGFIVDQPPYPDIPDHIKSPFFITPKSLQNFNQLLHKPGIIKIKAPHKMGKTSFINRIIAEAEKQKYQIVYLNLSAVEKEQYQDIKSFYQSFFDIIMSELPELNLSIEWPTDSSKNTKCTEYLQKILTQLKTPLVLILDEVDKVFDYPIIYQDFFSMLRNWHEKGTRSKNWEKLRLIVSYSTDDYGRLDIHQSPFNVGTPITLQELNEEEVKTLTSRHGLTQDTGITLMKLVGGHPYLLRLALYELYYEHTTLNELQKNAPTNTGIYKEHLLYYLKFLQENQDLKEVFKTILASFIPIKLREKTIAIYQLEAMGLIKLVGDTVEIRCRLYRLYFSDRLG